MAIKPKDMAKILDYTVLNPTVTALEVKKRCEEARDYEFASVSVYPCFVPLAAKLLENSSVKVCTVIGFPLGANTSETKAYETKNVIRNGAQEIDMTVNMSAVKAHNWDAVKEDIKAVVDATKIAGVTKDIINKVIVETSYLTEEEIKKVCKVAKKAGADFIRTSTGFGNDSSNLEEVSLIRKNVGRAIGVKAAGNINTFDEALEMLDAGANRIGSSSGIAIVTGEEDK